MAKNVGDRNNRVIYFDFGRQEKISHTYFFDPISVFYRILKILVIALLLLVFPAGFIAIFFKEWEVATFVWMATTFLMFLLWSLEYRINRDFSLYKTED